MRTLKLKMQMWKWTAALALAVAPLQAGAESMFRWTAEDGSVSYTDDAKRIPERYRPAAQTIQTGGLSAYKRYSPARGEAQVVYAEQLAERVARLRELNRRLDEDAAPVYTRGASVTPQGGGTDAYVKVGDDLTLPRACRRRRAAGGRAGHPDSPARLDLHLDRHRGEPGREGAAGGARRSPLPEPDLGHSATSASSSTTATSSTTEATGRC